MEPLLQGAIDMHVHVSPDVQDRRLDFIEAAKECRDAGMKGLVYKDQSTLTIDRAYAVNKLFPEIQAFGGIVLNLSIGGLNPDAVKNAINLGAKIIWMPVTQTLHSINTREKLKWKFLGPSTLSPDKAQTILDKKEELVPEVIEIIDIIAKANIIVATGHISPKESLILIEEAKKRGVEKILVTHPSAETIGASLDEQKEMVKKGAYLEHCFAPCMPAFDRLDPEKIMSSIKLVKAENCVMSSDFGQVFNPTPVEGMIMYVRLLKKLGITDKEIQLMVKMNPSKLLGISNRE
jgi:hypothetical protein